MNLGKVFKKLDKNGYLFRLVPYETALTSYSELIKNQKIDGYRQVLFNVELMIELIKSIDLYSNLHLKNIKMCSDAAEDAQEEIDKLVFKSRRNKEIIYKIISELEWYSDKESIDVVNIELWDESSESSISIKSNGIISGENIELIFDEFVYPQIKRYFHEE